MDIDEDTSRICGDWCVNDEIFQPTGLQGIIDYANQKGLKFGIWLEIERCDKKAAGYSELLMSATSLT